MRHARLLGLIVTAGTALAGTDSANAEVTWTLDQAAWTSQVGGPGAVTAIDFGTVPGGAILNEQFAAQGLHFTEGRAARSGAAAFVRLLPLVEGGVDPHRDLQ